MRPLNTILNLLASRLARLEELASGDEPFFMGIAPYAPHVQNDQFRAIPLQRHAEMFPDAKAPRSRNWNPEDTFQKAKGSWLRDLPLMNKSVIEWADYSYRSRAQSLQGVDEIIEDVTAMLERHGIAENTYSKLNLNFVPNLWAVMGVITHVHVHV